MLIATQNVGEQFAAHWCTLDEQHTNQFPVSKRMLHDESPALGLMKGV
jgi:hypothetical protein